MKKIFLSLFLLPSIGFGQLIISGGSASGSGDAVTTDPLSQFAATTSLQLKGVISDETGSGALVFATSPTFVTPVLGTPSSGTLTSCTGLPIAGLTASTATALGIGSLELGHATDTTIARASAGAITVEGAAVLLSGGALGTPASATLTNATGLPIAGLTNSTSTALGLGSVELGHASDTTLSRASAGVLAVEGTNVLLNGGALGTPSSGTLTNATGLPVAGITASTATALGVGSIELGHASDTTIARSGAGAVTVEGTAVLLNGGALGTPSSATLTNATAATDSVAGVMSAADHTTLTSLSAQTSGTAPPFVGTGIIVSAFKTGIDMKTNAVTDIFTVPAGKTFVATGTSLVTTAVTGGASVSFAAKFIESSGSANITPTLGPGAASPAVGKVYATGITASASVVTTVAAAKVQLSITTGFTTSTTVTGTAYVQGYYF